MLICPGLVQFGPFHLYGLENQTIEDNNNDDDNGAGNSGGDDGMALGTCTILMNM